MKTLPRRALKIIEPQSVVEGAGVRLKRSIGTGTLDYLDPFLLLDHFASTNPRDYEAGFPLIRIVESKRLPTFFPVR